MEEIKQKCIEKYGYEVWLNMDRLAQFMAKMIHKYGPEILEEEKERKNAAKDSQVLIDPKNNNKD